MLSKAAKLACDAVAGACRIVKPNGCTLVPDFDSRPCCDAHDEAYTNQTMSRAEADKRLRDCIRRSGHPVRAKVYYAGVRALGWLFWYRKRKFPDAPRIEP